ncbi:MAG: outer membrane protein assembly factor BamD [Deltaproteobacteria bacterium]|nr:MAG: outer membrane protein assembly factor BamD [Deltaproteobacteria bacterium]RTZ98317.1 MAG: outer membrane protein assembly factor BamD [Deltaproteobacteria bacterium]
MNNSKYLIFFCISIFCLSSVGCAWFESRDQLTAQELATRGMDYDKREKYWKSLETFQHLKDWYPFSKFASLAELKIADAHYHLKEYEEAIFAYQEFETLHPRNEAIPYVIYQIGRCYFDRMDSVDRDQTVVRQAMAVFERLLAQHPESAYSKEAATHIVECKKSLAGHEMYVGRYYYKSGKYKGALARFQTVLTDYPHSGFDSEARKYIEKCQAFIKNQETTD